MRPYGGRGKRGSGEAGNLLFGGRWVRVGVREPEGVKVPGGKVGLSGDLRDDEGLGEREEELFGVQGDAVKGP